MKKFLSLLISLCLILGVASAFADTDPQIQAFVQNLQKHLNSFDPTAQALELNVPETFAASVQSAGGVDQIEITPADGSTVTMQIGEQALWIASEGQVVEIPASAVEELIRDMLAVYNPAFVLDEKDMEALEELVNLAVQKLIMPYASFSMSAGGTKIIFAMDGTQLSAAAADLLRTVAAEPRYLELIAKIYNARTKMSRLSIQAMGYDPAKWGMAEMTADALALQLRTAADNAEANKPDVVINATVEVGRDTANLHASVTSNGKTVYIDGAVVEGGLTVKAYDNSETFIELAMSFAESFGEQTFTGKLEVPSARLTVELEGSLGRNTLRGSLKISSFGRVTTALLTAMWMNDTVDANLSVTGNNRPVFSGNLHKNGNQLTVTAAGEGFNLNAALNVDPARQTGSCTVNFSDRRQNVTIEGSWDGTSFLFKAPGGELKCVLRGISDTEMAADIDITTVTSSYYGGEASSNTVSGTVLYTLADDGDNWTLTIEAKSEDETQSLTLRTAPLHEQTPLAGQATRVLTEADLFAILSGYQPLFQPVPAAVPVTIE